jgi:hypothetical protein
MIAISFDRPSLADINDVPYANHCLFYEFRDQVLRSRKLLRDHATGDLLYLFDGLAVNCLSLLIFCVLVDECSIPERTKP